MLMELSACSAWPETITMKNKAGLMKLGWRNILKQAQKQTVFTGKATSVGKTPTNHNQELVKHNWRLTGICCVAGRRGFRVAESAQPANHNNLTGCKQNSVTRPSGPHTNHSGYSRQSASLIKIKSVWKAALLCARLYEAVVGFKRKNDFGNTLILLLKN